MRNLTGRMEYRLVDLTLTLSEGMPHHPAHPRGPVFLSGTLSHELSQAWLRKGTPRGPLSFANEQILLSGHTGTHIDAPYHFDPKGATAEAIPLDYACGPAVCLKVEGRNLPRALVSVADLEQALSRQGAQFRPITLIHTGWSQRLKTDPQEYYSASIGLSGEAARWLRSQHVRTVGIDAPSVDPPRSDCAAHLEFLRPPQGEPYICIIENLVNLEAIEASYFWFLGAPLPFQGASGSPIRAFALVPKQEGEGGSG